MKLIDILVEELPKRGGWPDDSDEMSQSQFDCEIYTESKFLPDFYVGERAEDNGIDNGVTREQYEAALAAKNDGWIEWGGGECPVPCGTMVDVKHRCGAVSENQQAWPKRHKESDVMVNPLSNAGQAFWRHENSVMDIIAYRLHQPQQAEQPWASEEDLNECIGQDSSTAWSVRWLPSSGCECEYQYKVHGSEWCSFECVAVDGNVAFGWSNNTPIALQLNTHNFRPMRSNAERRRDDAKHAIAELCRSSASNGHAADLIYDAIATGKIPGIKLED